MKIETINSKIRNEGQIKQAIDFSKFGKKNIYFTDVDAKIEIDDKFSIAIEVKRFGNNIEVGQKLMFERDAIAWLKAGMYDCDRYIDGRAKTGDLIFPGKIEILKRKSIILKAEHDTNDTTQLIPLDQCIVTQVFIQKLGSDVDMWWEDVVGNITVYDYLKDLIGKDKWNIKRWSLD